MRIPRRFLLTCASAIAVMAAIPPTEAQERWQPFNPFADIERKKAAKRSAAPSDTRQPLAPMNGTRPGADSQKSAAPNASGTSTGDPANAPANTQVMREAIPPPVEKGDLAPVMATDGSGLPFELWRGLTADRIEKLISEIQIPPRSPSLHGLWKRLITADVTAPAGTTSDGKFTALRLEALYRSGLAKEAAAELAKHPASTDPLIVFLTARNELASGNASKACELISQATAQKSDMPKRLKGQAVLMSGYCAVVANDAASAGLAAELAREEGQEPSPGLDALDAISINAKPKIAAPKTLTLLDYRLVEKVQPLAHKDVLEKGEPALLVALSSDATTPIDLGLPAAEAAVKLNALAPEMLAAIYRTNAPSEPADVLLSGNGKLQGAFRRAALFKAADSEQTPMKKTRLIRAFLDDAKRQGMYFQALQMSAAIIAPLNPQPEISWFAETGSEIGLAAGQYDLARRWVQTANMPGRPGGSLDHWLALIDLADPAAANREKNLPALEQIAISGRFKPDDLHRLATVLDALLYQVPIPLWDAASRTPQPSGGFLPETGVLSELQDAAKKSEFGRTVLLVMKALGPGGAEGAHMIALGDSIRALKRAGLEPDARRLGLEALLAAWPRSTAN